MPSAHLVADESALGAGGVGSGGRREEGGVEGEVEEGGLGLESRGLVAGLWEGRHEGISNQQRGIFSLSF